MKKFIKFICSDINFKIDKKWKKNIIFNLCFLFSSITLFFPLFVQFKYNIDIWDFLILIAWVCIGVTYNELDLTRKIFTKYCDLDSCEKCDIWTCDRFKKKGN